MAATSVDDLKAFFVLFKKLSADPELLKSESSPIPISASGDSPESRVSNSDSVPSLQDTPVPMDIISKIIPCVIPKLWADSALADLKVVVAPRHSDQRYCK